MDGISKWVAPTAVALLVTAGAGGAVLLRDGGTNEPRALRLTGQTGTREADAAQGAPAASGSANGSSYAGNGGYRYSGTLSTEQPGDRPVWRLAEADADDAARVAEAFGLSGEPKRSGDAWVVNGGKGRSVTLYANGSWSYGPGCPKAQPSDGREIAVDCASGSGSVSSSGTVSPDTPVSSGNTPTKVDPAPSGGSGSSGSSPGCDPRVADCVAPDAPAPCDGPDCTVSSPPSGGKDEPPPAEPEPGPSDAEARKAAQPVFTALGLGDAVVTTYVSSPQTSVQADPRVSGLETNGFATWVTVDRDGTIAAGNGTLTDVVRGDTYPLISAKEAFDALEEQPRALGAAEMCPIGPDGKGCGSSEPVELSDARLGLAVHYESERLLLVPAWLFTVKTGGVISQVAVEPSYLAEPEPVKGEPEPDPAVPPVEGGGSDPGTTEQGGTDPGSTEPDSDSRTNVSWEAWSASATPTEIVVHFGESGSCPYTHVSASTKEGPDVVVVTLTADDLGDRACTADYHAREITVKLLKPVGERKVVDGSSGGEARPKR